MNVNGRTPTNSPSGAVWRRLPWLKGGGQATPATSAPNGAKAPAAAAVAAASRPTTSADPFVKALPSVAQSRGFDAAEQMINDRSAKLWGRLSVLAEPTDPIRALDYAQRYAASVEGWIAWLQRPPVGLSGLDEAESLVPEDLVSEDLVPAAALARVREPSPATKPAWPAPKDRLLQSLDWKAEHEGLDAAEQLVVSNHAKALVALSKLAQPHDLGRALGYAQRAYDLDPQAAIARRLQQLLFARGDIVISERLFRSSLEATGGPVTRYEVERLGRLQGWKSLLLHGFPLPERQTTPQIDPLAQKVIYFLAHSLPQNGSGYASRSHGLLGGLQSTEYSVVPCTRYGFPWDRADNQRVEPRPEFPLEDNVNGIRYRRLRTLAAGRSQLPPDRYMQTCADEFEAFARAERPSVIHAASNYEVALPAITAARRLGLPVIYEVRGLWEVTQASQNTGLDGSELFETQVRLEAAAAKAADRVIAITNPLKAELVRRGVSGDRITVVPNSVDPQRFVPVARDLELQQQLGLEGKRVVGYVGSVTHYEGLDQLLYAASFLIDEGMDHLHLLLVGNGVALPRLQGLVADLELTDNVTLTGAVPFDEVNRYYSLIDIAPFPRKPLPVTEMVSPLKPYEAMAMEKAVLVSSVGALAEMVQDGDTGLVFEKGNIDSLVDKLALLVGDPELCGRLGKSAREWVIANRTWERAGAVVAKIYRELEDGHGNIVSSEPELTTV
jgi:glycosyltransferase involved in cell wall biosynthesis